MVRRFFGACLHFILCLVEAFLWVLGAWIAAGWWGWRSDRIEILVRGFGFVRRGEKGDLCTDYVVYLCEYRWELS